MLLDLSGVFGQVHNAQITMKQWNQVWAMRIKSVFRYFISLFVATIFYYLSRVRARDAFLDL